MQPLTCMLLVDHDQASNFLTERCLCRAGVQAQVQVASSGQHGLTQLTGLRPPAPELLFVNYNLHTGLAMSGRQFVAEVAQRYPARDFVIAILATQIKAEALHQLQGSHLRGPIFHKPLTKEDVELLLAQHFPDVQPTA